MLKLVTKSTMIMLTALFCISTTGCWEKDTATKAEEAVEDAGQQVEQNVEHATEEAAEAVEPAPEQ